MIINTILTTSVFTHLAGTYIFYIIQLIRNRRTPRKHVSNFIDEEPETNPNPKFLGSFPSLVTTVQRRLFGIATSERMSEERERERERALFIFGLAPSSRGVLLVGVGRRRSFAKRARRGQARQAAGDVYEAQAGAAQRSAPAAAAFPPIRRQRRRTTRHECEKLRCRLLAYGLVRVRRGG